jgi:hypothetical protein
MLPVPEPQYFYANQGPTYGGPGMLAPVPTYQESSVSGGYQTGEAYSNGGEYGMPAMEGPAGYGYQQHYYRPHRAYYGGYATRMNYRYGYAPHRYAQHYGMGYGYRGASRYYGQRGLRRYY